MRRWSFIVAVLGILILLLFLRKEPIKVGSLDDVIEGTKVEVVGTIVSEGSFDKFSVMKIDDIEIVCSCFGFKDKEVRIIGSVEVYEGRKQVRVLEISELEK